LRLAASLEQNSEHALAAAIVQGAKAQGIALVAATGFRSKTGGGVLGEVAGRALMIGTPVFLKSERIGGLEPLEASGVKVQDAGKTAIDGRPAGIKPTTAAAVGELHTLGLKLVMLTGDKRRTAEAVAGKLNLDSVEAQIEPAGKAASIMKLRAEGERIAMGIRYRRSDPKRRHHAREPRPPRDFQSNPPQSRHNVAHPGESGLRLSLQLIEGAAMSLSSVSVILNALQLRRITL